MSTIVSAPESLFPRLEPLLARVAKPIQYVGGEVNSVVKPWESAEVRWALMYPDAYEVGQPNQVSRSCTRCSMNATGSSPNAPTPYGQTSPR